MVNEDTLLADLAIRTEAELITIRDEAREVVYSHSTQINALSQSTVWDKQSADMVLRLANQVLTGLASGSAGATDPVTLRPTLGHPVRFGGRCIVAP